MLRLVLAAGAVLSPLAGPILRRRLKRGKEDETRWVEKLGQATADRPDGPLIWMHGVGVGEVMALRGLIDTLMAQRSDLNFLVTSSARSSANVFAHNMPPRTQHQYLPLDFPAPVKAFLDHWQPELAVWSDQEVWPRLAVACARRAIPQALVAARITPASGRAKARFGAAYGDLYRLLDVRHAQDAATADQLRMLMGDEAVVQVTGSLKAAAAPLTDDEAARDAVVQASGRPIWVAASAHPADIDVAVAAHHYCATEDGAKRMLIVAPRNLGDAERVETACLELGLNCARRSADGMPNGDTEVYIADTFGELGLWYRAAFAALIGGTFDSVEGHNPWEAVAVGCPVLHGPHIKNFTNDFQQLNGANAVRAVEGVSDIVAALNDTTLPEIATRATAVRDRAAKGLSVIADDLLGQLPR